MLEGFGIWLQRRLDVVGLLGRDREFWDDVV